MTVVVQNTNTFLHCMRKRRQQHHIISISDNVATLYHTLRALIDWIRPRTVRTTWTNAYVTSLCSFHLLCRRVRAIILCLTLYVMCSFRTQIMVCLCFNQHRELMDSVSLWIQRADHWRSHGCKQSQRQNTVLLATRSPNHLVRTLWQWVVWRLDHTTRSQCGLLALSSLSVTTLPALNLQVCRFVKLDLLPATPLIFAVDSWQSFVLSPDTV